MNEKNCFKCGALAIFQVTQHENLAPVTLILPRLNNLPRGVEIIFGSECFRDF